MILTRRPVGFVSGPLQPLLPVPDQPLSLALDILAGRQAQLEHRRFQDPKHLPADQVIDDTTGEAGTGRHSTVPLVALTAVAIPTGAAGVEDPHAAAAVPAHQQAAQ